MPSCTQNPYFIVEKFVIHFKLHLHLHLHFLIIIVLFYKQGRVVF